MARPTKSGLDYFPHDTDASSDDKLEALQSIYGNDGYAFFFKLLERIYRSENAELNVSDAETVQILCRKHLLIKPDQFPEMIATAIKWGCFDRVAFEQRKVLTSPGVKKRAGVVFEKRKEMQDRYEKLKHQNNQDNAQKVSGAETAVSGGFLFTRESKAKNNQDIDNLFISGDKGDVGEKRDFCQITASEINEDSKKEAGEVWSRVLTQLQRQISIANYRTWLNKTEGLICRQDVFIVGVPSSFVAQYLDHNLRSLIEKTVIDVTNSKYDISFLVEHN